MMCQLKSRKLLLYLGAPVVAFGLLAATALPVAAAEPPATEAVTMTVTAVGKKQTTPPTIKKEDVNLFQNKERSQIANLRRSDSLYLAILIDESLNRDVALEWKDVKAFINAQPPDTYVAIAYARNGAANVAQDFTNDHALAAKALRMPVNGAAAYTSPYLALQDWIKRWPDNGGDRRSIILLSSGIDYFRGSGDPINPDLDTTIQRAQKQNINVWTIYYPDQGQARVGRRGLTLFNSQMFLSQLSEQTGAESFQLFYNRPVSLKPYFDQIQDRLNNQYLLTFDAGSGGKKGKFESVRVATEIPSVQFMTPSEVYLPAAR
jgi:VWFA-related protein